MVVEEWLVGLALDRVVRVQDLDRVALEQEFLDQVEQEDLDQVELEAMDLVQVGLVLVDSDQEELVQVPALMLGDLNMMGPLEYVEVPCIVRMDQWAGSFL